jgi:hypothetical protein
VQEISTSAENVKKMSDELRFSLFLKLNILEENFEQEGIKLFYFIYISYIEM